MVKSGPTADKRELHKAKTLYSLHSFHKKNKNENEKNLSNINSNFCVTEELIIKNMISEFLLLGEDFKWGKDTLAPSKAAILTILAF